MKCVVSFAKNGMQALLVEPNTNLMKALLQQGIPVASSCGGEGICGKCRLLIVDGESHLSKKSETEQFLCQTLSLKPTERISCQTFVLGDVKVDAGYW
jgi:2Fe-2S ferredoxin